MKQPVFQPQRFGQGRSLGAQPAEIGRMIGSPDIAAPPLPSASPARRSRRRNRRRWCGVARSCIIGGHAASGTERQRTAEHHVGADSRGRLPATDQFEISLPRVADIADQHRAGQSSCEITSFL